METPLVSINIPAYRQLPLARLAIDSIRAQTYPHFELTVFDDGASDEYRDYIFALGDPRVRYQRNPERLGAMRNMFAAIGAGRGKYTLAFHEDDLLGAHYLEAAVAILESRPECGFVACELREFKDHPSPDELTQAWDGTSIETIQTPADFLRVIFKGIEPMFGSIVYRRTALAGVAPAHDVYATLVDRPFLLSILEKYTAAVITAPLVWYRYHDEHDGRHLAMSTEHVVRLFATYRSVFPVDWLPADATAFYRYSAYWMPELHRLSRAEGRSSKRRFLFDAWRRGLYKPRALR